MQPGRTQPTESRRRGLTRGRELVPPVSALLPCMEAVAQRRFGNALTQAVGGAEVAPPDASHLSAGSVLSRARAARHAGRGTSPDSSSRAAAGIVEDQVTMPPGLGRALDAAASARQRQHRRCVPSSRSQPHSGQRPVAARSARGADAMPPGRCGSTAGRGRWRPGCRARVGGLGGRTSPSAG
jgi:hypothetical protein